MLFRRLTRKATAAIRRTRRRPAEMYHDPRPQRLDSVSDITPSIAPTEPPLFTNELRPLPRLNLVLKRASNTNNLAKSEDVSHLELNDDDRLNLDPAFESEGHLKRQRKHATCLAGDCSITRADSPATPATKLIIIQNETPNQRALLLTPAAHMRMQALAGLRQELRALDAVIVTNTAEVKDLIVAKDALESLEIPNVPGAFYDDNAHVERERRHLLMLTFLSKLRLCEKTLEDLDEQRLYLVAELDVVREGVLEGLERAFRDDHSPAASGVDVGGDRKSLSWWAK